MMDTCSVCTIELKKDCAFIRYGGNPKIIFCEKCVNESIEGFYKKRDFENVPKRKVNRKERFLT